MNGKEGTMLKFKCNGSTYILSVEPLTTLAEMKVILVEEHDIPVMNSQFIISGEEIRDDMTADQIQHKLKSDNIIWVYFPILKTIRPDISTSPSRWRPSDKGMTPAEYYTTCLSTLR